MIGVAIQVAFCVHNHASDGFRPICRPAREVVKHRLLAFLAHLPHHSNVVRTARIRGTIEIALLIHDRNSEDITAVRTPREGIEDGYFAGLAALIHRSRVRAAALFGYAIDVAHLVEEHSCKHRIRTVLLPAREDMQYREVAVLTQFEQSSELAFAAALRSSTVEIARCITKQPSGGIASVRASGKTVQHLLVPTFAQLEHGSHTRRPAALCSAIQVARWVSGQSGHRVCPVAPTLETVQHGFLVGCVELKYGAVAGSTALISSTVEVTRLVAEHRGVGISAVRLPGEIVKCGESLRLCQSR